eukprot:TRINITY_DN63375_c0_g1_i1.p1 TRINITY_DN63375_c0_g1~~TRINITY_DN63375_c0_g1_i1.p1  ORF type:complete len:458 (+),score=62.37 TRINITY_DN63375_c0_g1_i1:75-1376(+)
MVRLILLLGLWDLLCAAEPPRGKSLRPNRRPVIGILSSPLQLPGATGYGNYSWIWSTYVDTLHALGADVVPLDMRCSLATLRKKLDEVDAALLTGGSDDAGVHGNRYPDAMFERIKTLFQKATRPDPLSSSGVFPLWATCQGFQAVCVLGAQDPKVVVPTFGTDFSELPLNLTEVSTSSRLLGSAPKEILQELTGHKATLNFHEFGVLASSFTAGSSPAVNGFRLLATDTDTKGQTFAAIMEHEKYEIFGTQFHPEMYSWVNRNETVLEQQINRANMYLMRYFVERARAAMKTMRPFSKARLVKWYPRVSLPVSVLGKSFSSHFPGRKLYGYVFDACRPIPPAEMATDLAGAPSLELQAVNRNFSLLWVQNRSVGVRSPKSIITIRFARISFLATLAGVIVAAATSAACATHVLAKRRVLPPDMLSEALIRVQ